VGQVLGVVQLLLLLLLPPSLLLGLLLGLLLVLLVLSCLLLVLLVLPCLLLLRSKQHAAQHECHLALTWSARLRLLGLTSAAHASAQLGLPLAGGAAHAGHAGHAGHEHARQRRNNAVQGRHLLLALSLQHHSLHCVPAKAGHMQHAAGQAGPAPPLLRDMLAGSRGAGGPRGPRGRRLGGAGALRRRRGPQASVGHGIHRHGCCSRCTSCC
jgi:hypothetical protein